MAEVTYRIVEHEGGYAYKVGETISERFATRDEAIQAAHIAAREQQVPGENVNIAYEDERGVEHEEAARGSDRPHTRVVE